MANNRKQSAVAAKVSVTPTVSPPSALLVAAKIVGVTVLLGWLLSIILPSSLLSGGGSSNRAVVVVQDVYAVKILPEAITSLLDRIGDTTEAVAEFSTSQSDKGFSQTLQLLSAALFDVNQVFEDEDPKLYQSKADVKRLVVTMQRLIALANGDNAAGGRQSLLFPSDRDDVAPLEPTVARWGVATATVFAQGVALADYHRILERDDLHSAALVAAMRSLERISTPGDGLEGIDFAGAEKLLAAADEVHDDTEDNDKNNEILIHHSMYRLFATSSMMSPEHALRRRTSMWEELIAIHPTYAPLRLHYIAAVLFDLEGDTLGSSGQNRYGIVGDLVDREKQAVVDGKRRGVDTTHGAILDVLKLHAALKASSSSGGGGGGRPLLMSAEAVASGFKAFQRLRTLGMHNAAPSDDGRQDICDDVLRRPWMANDNEEGTVKKSNSASSQATWEGRMGGIERPELLRKNDLVAVRNTAATAIVQHVGDNAKVALNRCLF
jgi:hypothetical protein